MNKVIDLKINVKEVLVVLIIYGLLVLFALALDSRFDRLGLSSNCIINDNMVEFITE